MNHQEITLLTRYVKAMCPAQAIDDMTPDAWMDVLSDLQLSDCQAAIVGLKRGNNPPTFLDVADIRKAVRAMRDDRIARAPHYEPNSGITLAEWNRRAGDGQPVPTPKGLKHRDMRAIEGTFRDVAQLTGEGA